MPHPEREHELQIALATALRERDEARERWTHFLNQAFAAESALAAARRECEGLREAISDLIQEMKFGGGCDGTDPSCDGCVAVEAARAALAAPGDGEKKAPEAECAGCRYGFSIGMDGRHWYTGGTGSNVSMDCAKRPRKP